MTLKAWVDGVDETGRVKLASDPATPPSMLWKLAHDPAVTVRAAVAMNGAAPAQSDCELAADEDERVRLLIARKIGAAISNLPAAEQTSLRDRTIQALTTLVHDEAVRVRTIVAEMVASLPGLPHALALDLAHDSAISVSEPVIRLSPLLSPDDLLALVACPPHAAAMQAVASRADLPENVSDAIAASADSDAIRVLLSNPSAAIRENTLDAMIARATRQPCWHEPLVRRPHLPLLAARALSEIVTGYLLEVLGARTDLDPALAAELRQRVSARLASGPAQDGTAALMEAARALESCGGLGEPALLDALRTGELRRAAALLAVAAGVGIEVVDRAVRLHSAKGLVSLVWKAGFAVRIATAVQATIGQLSPAAMLPAAIDGGFPLSAEEMRWQLDFLGRSGRPS